MSRDQIDHIIELAFEEDLDKLGDITSMSLFDEAAIGEGSFILEQDAVVSGIEVLERCFYIYDHSAIVKALVKDGQSLKAGTEIASVKGRIRTLLAVERVSLNFLSHLSGIASTTRTFVNEIKDTSAKLKDTRKTIPVLRVLEKKAVTHGGGLNHRFGLYDAILIKDNHLAAIPSPLGGEGQGEGRIIQAVAKSRECYPQKSVEVEVENLDQVKEALEAKADVLLLDNMDVNQLKEAVALIDNRAETESSGGISIDNIKEIAQTGIDYISTSAITMAAMPVSFKFEVK